DGGRKREEVKKTKIEQEKIALEERNLLNKLSRAVFSNVQFLSASYKEVKLAERAFNAAQANYNMVQDAYLTGVVNISQLIDAQNAMLKTKIMALSAQYQYALDFIKTERLQGRYTFLDSKNEKNRYRNLMLTYLNR
ncbi:MAG: TolC family protein, partial [Bacteroidales bacterium]